MILDMDKDSTRKWVAVVVAASYGFNSEQFKELISDNDWNDRAIDFRVTMNGIEFTELDDMFDRLHKYIVEQKERIEDLEIELTDLKVNRK